MKECLVFSLTNLRCNRVVISQPILGMLQQYFLDEEGRLCIHIKLHFYLRGFDGLLYQHN